MWSEFVGDLGSFIIYFVSGLAAVLIYSAIYMAITAHNEFALIKENNQAAALAFAGSLLGFVIAISRLIEDTVNIGNFFLWALVAIIVQLIAYVLVRVTLPGLSERIENGEFAAAIWLAGASVAAGLLNAASLSS